MTSDTFDLTGKIAIVTGGSRGLGKAMALGLANHGANIVVADMLDSGEIVNEINELGRECLYVKTDVSKKEDIENLVEKTLGKFGRIDILINNAGILRMGPAEETKEEDWDKIMSVNLRGCFLCSIAVGREMIKQKSGRIINIASIAGLGAFHSTLAYNASKGGVVLLTKSLAIEWAKYGINVNAIAPGAFDTSMTSAISQDEETKKMITMQTPLGRMGKPDELAGAAIFLASPASKYVTGHVLVVDGGWTASC